MSALPSPEFGKTDKETLQNLMDTVSKFRKELNHLLMHLDETNIPDLSIIKGDIDGINTSISQTETEISLIAQGLAGAQSSISVMSGQIALKVSESDYTASVIVSKINGGTVTIEASRINLNGVTSMNGLTFVNKTLYLGGSSETGTLALAGGSSITGMEAGQQGFPEINLNAVVVKVNTSNFLMSGERVATENYVTSRGYITSSALSGYALQSWVQGLGYATQSWVQSQGYASGNFAVSNQNLRIQDYAGHLEIYQGSTFIGKLKYV